MLFPFFYESVRRGDLEKKEKRFPSRTRFNFKIRVHWTWGGIQRVGPLPSLPVPKKEGEREILESQLTTLRVKHLRQKNAS